MIAIVDYGAGNLTSVRLAFEALGVPATVTGVPEDIAAADRVVFPGVGAIGSAMANLKKAALDTALKAAIEKGSPFFGICLGTQILLDRSEEDGSVDALGVIPGAVRLFRPKFPTDKVPQIGWNSVLQQTRHPVFTDIRDSSEFYFVHSYYPAPLMDGHTLGVTDYAGVTFASVIGRDNVVAVQFHPERSGRVGLQMLKNFVEWKA